MSLPEKTLIMASRTLAPSILTHASAFSGTFLVSWAPTAMRRKWPSARLTLMASMLAISPASGGGSAAALDPPNMTLETPMPPTRPTTSSTMSIIGDFFFSPLSLVVLLSSLMVSRSPREGSSRVGVGEAGG